jgi:hypothetical protein
VLDEGMHLMTDPAQPDIPPDTPLPDAPGDDEVADDLTDLDLPEPGPESATDSDAPPAVDVVRPDPCTASGGQ